MKKHMGTTYTRDESNIKFIPTLCIPLLVLSIFGMLLLIILSVISIVHHNWTYAGCEMSGIVLLITFGQICDNLDWHRNAQLVVDGKRVTYYYDLDSKILPTSRVEVSVKFRKITKILELKNGDIKVIGDIEKKAPMGRPRMVRKFVLKNFGDQRDNVIQALKLKLRE